MQAEWKNYLQQAGAQYEDDRVRDFGHPRREAQVAMSGFVFADLQHQSLIRISGKDARSFLHNLLTNEVAQLGENQWQLNALCNAKGRVIATMRLFILEDSFYSLTPSSIAPVLMETLNKFILRSQVTIENVSSQFCHFGVSGTNSTQHLQQIIGALPEDLYDLTPHSDGCVLKIPGKLPRYEIIGAQQQAKNLWQKLDVHGAPVGASAWQLIDIRAGLVEIDLALTEQYVPQMVNLDLVQGLSFQKGCYPGQEIVARMHYRGKLKRRLYYATAKRDEIPPAGAPLYQPGLSASQNAGQVVSGTWAPDDGIELLAVVPIDLQQSGEIHLDSDTGPKLHFEPLPYALPD